MYTRAAWGRGGVAVGGRNLTASGGQTGKAPWALLPGQGQGCAGEAGLLSPWNLLFWFPSKSLHSEKKPMTDYKNKNN